MGSIYFSCLRGWFDNSLWKYRWSISFTLASLYSPFRLALRPLGACSWIVLLLIISTQHSSSSPPSGRILQYTYTVNKKHVCQFFLISTESSLSMEVISSVHLLQQDLFLCWPSLGLASEASSPCLVINKNKTQNLYATLNLLLDTFSVISHQ